MRIIYKLFVFVFVVIWATSSYSQTIIPTDSKYFFDQNLYEFQDMDDVFISNFDSYLEFQSALKSRKNSRFLGYTTLAAMGIGTLGPLLDPNDGCGGSFCITAGQFVAILSWLVVVPVVGTIAIITRVRYNTKKKKAISLFNQAQDIGHFNTSLLWDLKIGLGQSGVGLIVSF